MHILLTIALLSVPFSLLSMEQDKQLDSLKRFETFLSPHHRADLKVLNGVDLSKYNNILHLNCGSGAVTNIIALRAKHAYVTGMDYSRAMIKEAANNYEQDNIFFMPADPQKELPLMDKTVDLVFSTALSATKDKEALLDKIHRCLKSYGHVVLKAAGEVSDEHPMKATLNKLGETPQWQSFVERYRVARQIYPLDIQEAMNLFGSNKWRNTPAVEQGEVRYVFRSKNALAQFILNGMAAITSLEQTEKAAFVADFAEEYVKHDDTKAVNDDELILYDIPTLVIKAQKSGW